MAEQVKHFKVRPRTQEQRDAIAEAAWMAGKSLNVFLLEAALAAAKKARRQFKSEYQSN